MKFKNRDITTKRKTVSSSHHGKLPKKRKNNRRIPTTFEEAGTRVGSL